MSLESSTTTTTTTTAAAAAGVHYSPSHPHHAPRFRARSLQKVNEWGDASEPRKVQKRYTNSDNATEYEEYQYGSTLITYDENNFYPIEFSCSDGVQEDWLLSETVVWFDLEASFKKGADVESNVRALEWSLLNNVAETIGLKNDCALQVQHEELRRSLSTNPRRALTQTYLQYPTAILTLSSDPKDEYSTTGDCDFQMYDPSTEQCLKIRSRMWAQFRGDEMDKVDDYLRTIVSQKLESSPNVLFAGDISGITFVGDRDDAANMGIINGVEAQANATPSQGGLAAPVLGSVVAASAFAVVIGVLLLVTRRRRKDSATRKVEVDSMYTLDIETGSSTESPQKTDRPTFDQSIQSPTPRAKIMRQKAKGNPPRYPVPAPKQSEDTTDSDTTIAIAGYGKVATSGVVMVAGMSALPPRPPAQRRNSTNLKKKRRKKKRKKTKSLQRVNSKEGMNEMATIPESEGEDSEFGSEYESDYSTEEEYGSRPSSRASSAGNSPARPKSRSGSRASTPQLSPKDELFPTDVFSDYDFTIELPELLDAEEKPKEMFKPRITVVPPIKETIKLPPLPPI